MKKHPNNCVGTSALQITLSAALVSISAVLLASSFTPPPGSRIAFRDAAFAPTSTTDFTFTTIDVPGATITAAGGINNGGQIVGGYTLPDGTRHGFLDVGGTFTTVDDPLATFGTEASDINGSGQIAGSYDFTDPNHVFEGAHGFLLSGGTFTPIDFPADVTSTTPQGINDSGDVVGLYRMNSPGNGFLYAGGAYTTVNVPAELGCCTHANGINNAGQIVGQYKFPDDNGTKHGFLDTGGTFTTIDFPGAVGSTLSGINNFGDIVGNATDNTGAMFGFLYTGGNFFSISFPGALETLATKINDQGEIVGFYADSSGLLHGFQATMTGPAPQSAFSRKVHGGAGTFDIPLPLTGNVGVECRSGGATNDYQMIINFATSVTVESAAVTLGTGSVSSFTVSGSQVTVNLTGVTNVQRITVTLHNVNDGTHMGDVPVSMGVLVGDVNGNAVVNASDVALTKSQVGAAVSGSNFREDVNANGVINSVDVAQVKANVGTALPP